MLSDEEKERIRQQEQFRHAIQQEISEESEESKPTSTLGRLVSSDNARWIATTIAIPVAVGLWGLVSTHLAEEQRQQELKISVEQRNVDLVIKLLPAFEQEPGATARLNAIAVMQALEREGNLGPELRATLDRAKAQVDDQWDPRTGFHNAGARKESEAYASRIVPVPNSDGASQPVASSLPGAQVYIHIFDETWRTEAEVAQKAIRDAGVGVPGIENVVRTAQRKNQKPPTGDSKTKLLVFQQSATTIAQRVAEAVTNRTGTDVKVEDRWANKSYPNVPLGQLELWFPSTPAP